MSIFFHRFIGYCLLAGLFAAVPVGAAIVIVEDFEGGANGWTDRDAGEMTVTHQASVGAPASGAMQGVFAGQVFAVPQTDAFIINSGTDFLGGYAGITGFTFDLFALNVLPSDATLRLISGANTFFYTLNLAAMGVGVWTGFEVSLTYSSGWVGGAAAFNAALSSVDQVEVQLTRSGLAAQTYYLDNFATTDQDFGDGGGGGGSAVPEPDSLTLILFAGLLVLVARNRMPASRNAHGEPT
jgi:hypothetical protein